MYACGVSAHHMHTVTAQAMAVSLHKPIPLSKLVQTQDNCQINTPAAQLVDGQGARWHINKCPFNMRLQQQTESHADNQMDHACLSFN